MNFFNAKNLIACLVIFTLAGCDRVVIIRGVVPQGKSCFLDVATQSFDDRPRAIAGAFEQYYTIGGIGERFKVVEVTCNQKVLLRKEDIALEDVIDLGKL